jgi:hypothetical protein
VFLAHLLEEQNRGLVLTELCLGTLQDTSCLLEDPLPHCSNLIDQLMDPLDTMVMSFSDVAFWTIEFLLFVERAIISITDELSSLVAMLATD